MKYIEVIVGTDGQSRVETHGFIGAECRNASAFLEATLGTTEREQTTAAFHELASQSSVHVNHSELER
jgi:hypothetical protein